ncbi:hypothetical protein VCRA2121O436_50033 [Vibrio crassostreae]|nr:hypothetical protein VCRA2121O436_50033 [Vibrio crassostreae]
MCLEGCNFDFSLIETDAPQFGHLNIEHLLNTTKPTVSILQGAVRVPC